MAFCIVCQTSAPNGLVFCTKCGMALDSRNNLPAFGSAGRTRIYFSQAIATTVGLVALSILFISDLPLLLQPFLYYLLIGLFVVVARIPDAAIRVERFAQPVAIWAQSSPDRQRPWLLVKIKDELCDWISWITAGIADPFVRSGVRVILWLVYANLVLIVILNAIIVAIYVAMIVLAAIFFITFIYFFLKGMLKSSRKPQASRAEFPDIFPSRRSSWNVRPQHEYHVVEKNGQTVLRRDGFFEKEIKLDRQEFEEVETFESANITGPKIQIGQSTNILGIPDPNRLRVSSEDAHLGDLVRDAPDENFEFEPPQNES